MAVNPESLLDYSNFVKRIVSTEKLNHFDKDGMVAVVEYGVKLAGRQNKISTQFHQVADILREAARINGLRNYDVWFKMIGKPDPRPGRGRR